jgi:hypothetical protein
LAAFAGPLALPVERAHAARSCGPFRVEGLRTSVRVYVVRGSVGCATARGVMRSLFAAGSNRTVRGWRCVGPQTGYAACTKGVRRIRASF